MGKEEENPNPNLDIPGDLVEDILLRLPLKPILKFKIVSKQWRSTLESKSFVEKRRRKSKSVQKNPKILAVGGSRFQGDSEMEVFYLQRTDATTRPWLTCDGLVCITVPDWIIVLNPSTGEFLRFATKPAFNGIDGLTFDVLWKMDFPTSWAMGFGRDEVTGSYKVVRLLFYFNIFEILDVHIGEWRKLRRHPPYKIEWTRKSACVNGSIYWLDLEYGYHVLALDLHTEKFHDLPALPLRPRPTASAQIVNLENRLAIAYITRSSNNHRGWKLEIWSMDTQQEETTWTMTYSISLSPRVISPPKQQHLVGSWWLTPMAVSKQGNLVLYGCDKGLFKYYPETDYLSCLSRDIYVITPFVENLVPLPCLQAVGSSVLKISTSGYQYGLACFQPPGFVSKLFSSTLEFVSKLFSSTLGFVARMKPLTPNVWLISSITLFWLRMNLNADVLYPYWFMSSIIWKLLFCSS